MTLDEVLVTYQLNDGDVQVIDNQRANGASAGNFVSAGDVFPAVVVKNWGTSVNLQVLLDGSDTYWRTSAPEGTGPGTFQRLTTGEIAAPVE